MSKFNVSYNSRKVLKSQMFEHFIEKMTISALEPSHTWEIFTYGSSNSRGSGSGLIVECESSMIIKVSTCFDFPATNNQIVYEVVIASLALAAKMRISLRTKS